MLAAIVQFLFCATIIVIAGSVLTRCADAIAEVTGLGRLVVGSVLLAGATSLPELTVDISAIRLGLPDLAVGDLLGSSLCNLLILAVLDLSNNSRGRMLSREAAGHALSGMVSIALTAAVGLTILTAKQTTGWAFGGINVGIWIIVAGYVLGIRLVFLDQRISMRAAVEAVADKVLPVHQPSLRKAIVGFGLASFAILVSGPYLADAAGRLAELSGLGSTFVGTTFVALSTSLPELVSSIAALRMGAHDLAIGNVFGSNAFNMILFAPLDALHPGSLFAAVSASHLISCFTVTVCTSVVLMGQLYQSPSRSRFIEPDAWLVIGLIVASLAMVYGWSG
jgi:cation:H+ antiporter